MYVSAHTWRAQAPTDASDPGLVAEESAAVLDGGRGAAVIEQRMAFQDLMRDRFNQVVEDATGRQVVGFMSGNQQDPDIMCEVFILAPTDLVDPRSDHHSD